jgi:hypothetical protein
MSNCRENGICGNLPGPVSSLGNIPKTRLFRHIPTRATLSVSESAKITTRREDADTTRGLDLPQNAHVVVALGGVQSGLAFGAGSHGRREPEPGRLSH